MSVYFGVRVSKSLLRMRKVFDSTFSVNMVHFFTKLIRFCLQIKVIHIDYENEQDREYNKTEAQYCKNRLILLSSKEAYFKSETRLLT